MVAVPDTFEEFITTAQNKLGLCGVVSVYTKNGGLLDEVDLIRY